MEDKHAAFERLSEKRLEAIEDAVRIWSNLSGPSYEWTISEVMEAVDRIRASALKAVERFRETRQWRAQVDLEAEAFPECDPRRETAVEPAAAPDAPPDEAAPSPREIAMLRIWRDPANEEGALMEMLAMQREVIGHLQAQIDAHRA